MPHLVSIRVRQKATINAENQKKEIIDAGNQKGENRRNSCSNDDYLEKHFAEKSRDLKFYDFPAYWKDNDIYESRIRRKIRGQIELQI